MASVVGRPAPRGNLAPGKPVRIVCILFFRPRNHQRQGLFRTRSDACPSVGTHAIKRSAEACVESVDLS